MAQIAFEYKIVTGKANEQLSQQLAALSSSSGWVVAEMTALDSELVVLLRREKDFEVAQSLQQALENAVEEPAQIIDAIAKPQNEQPF